MNPAMAATILNIESMVTTYEKFIEKVEKGEDIYKYIRTISIVANIKLELINQNPIVPTSGEEFMILVGANRRVNAAHDRFIKVLGEHGVEIPDQE